jgi:small subunit ribosomal protein S9
MADEETPETTEAEPQAAEQEVVETPAAAAEPEPEAPATPEPTAEAPASEPENAAEAPGRVAVEPPAQATSEARPVVPGADLEVDIVPEGVDPLASDAPRYSYEEELEEEDGPAIDEIEEVVTVEPIEQVAIDLAAGARYHATGKRKSAIARVILRPGTGSYTINGRTLEAYFPRETLQRNIRQPLETVGYEERMDVVARMEGGGVSAQAGALRHGISRALLEADPNLRGELKRRGFLTRDARAKERKKAGLKKARKRPQFSKR